MLPLYNDCSREADVPVESEENFAARLGFPRVSANNEGHHTMLYFDDDGLFAGHIIEAWVNGVGDVVNARLAG